MRVAQGGTIRLHVLYEDSSNALVDPASPLLEIIDPLGSVINSGLVPMRESVGQYYYDVAAAQDAALGTWTARFTGIIDGATVADDESFEVVPPGGAGTVFNLITLPEFRTAAGIDVTDTRNDAKVTQLIPYVSTAIKAYTERDFGAPAVTEERVFEYDGSGFLDIDDASAITQVALTYPTSLGSPDIVLGVDDWTPKPSRRDDAPLYTYIELPSYIGSTWGSPEMGFTRNLDVYVRERGSWAIPNRIKVTGTWGWPVVPGDVKMAAIWTLQEWLSRPEGEQLTAESIEGWSRAWGSRTGAGAAALAIPERARDILTFYAKVTL